MHLSITNNMYCMLQEVDSLQRTAQSLQVQTSDSQKKKCSMQFPKMNSWFTVTPGEHSSELWDPMKTMLNHSQEEPSNQTVHILSL